MTQSNPLTITRPQVIKAISHLRQEWQQAIEDESLLEAKANVGLLLLDMVIALELTLDEQIDVLGVELFTAMDVASITPKK